MITFKNEGYMKKLLCCILIFCILLSASCAKNESNTPLCYEIVQSLCEEELSLPAGIIYSSRAKEGEDGYIKKQLLASILGNGKQLDIFNFWDDIAIFLPSGDGACEFIVIHCTHSDNIPDTARLLSTRINDLNNSKGEKHPEYFEKREILTVKNYVIMAVSKDVPNAHKIAKDIISKHS